MSDTDWNSNLGHGFGRHVQEDEFFHGTGDPVDSLTETWYWNFHVPEAAINCFVYCWVHPTLKVVSSGLFIFKGMKRHHLQCELFEYFDYMSSSVIGDGSDIKLPNGLRVQVIDPLQKVHLAFEDKVRDTKVDVVLDAVDVPIMRANNKHFEQVMHATGSLRLRGEDYDVDCYPVRDRSWAEPRPESHNPAPPYTWVTGSFGPEFAFNVGSHDDPDRNPDWIGILDVPKRIFNDGWVVKNGEQRRVVSSSKITERTRDAQAPIVHHYRFEDDKGDRYEMTGRLIAQTLWGGWSNSLCHIGLVEWDWDGRKGYGESQEVQWNDYNYKMSSRG